MSDVGQWYDLNVLAQPLARLVGLAPALNWKPISGGYRATNDAESHARWGCRASRVECRLGPGGVTFGPVIHGEGRVITWLELFHGVFPRGAAYPRAVAELGRALGLDTSEIDGSAAPMTEAQRAEREAQREEASAILAQRAREAETEAMVEREARINEARAAWDAASVIEDSVNPAWQYLQTRLNLWPRGPRAGNTHEDAGGVGENFEAPLPLCIRCVPDGQVLSFEYKGARVSWRGPLLVAQMCGPQGDDGLAIQIIPLGREKSGRVVKRGKVERIAGPDKPFYGTTQDDEGRPGGLWLPACGSGHGAGIVAACEGLETGWAVRAATGWPVMVMFSAGGLTTIDVSAEQLDGVHTLVVAGDHDDNEVGHRVAWAAGARLGLAHPHLAVRVAIPDDDGVRWKINLGGAGAIETPTAQDGEVG